MEKPRKYHELKSIMNQLPGGPKTRGAHERLMQGQETLADRQRIEEHAEFSRIHGPCMEDPNDPEPIAPPVQNLESLWTHGPTPIEDAARYSEVYHGLAKKIIQYQKRISESKTGTAKLKRQTPFGKLRMDVDQEFVNGMGGMAIRAQEKLQDEGYQSVVNEINDKFNIRFIAINPSQPKIIFEIDKNGNIFDMRGGDEQ